MNELNENKPLDDITESVKDRGINILVVGEGQIGKTTPLPKDNIVVIGNETKPIPFYAPPPLPQIDLTPYWDGKSARNKRREAERKAKKRK